jgi:hypothetical protein
MSTLAYFALGAVVAVLGYREAQRHVEKFGVGPWKVPPLGWAAICFLTGGIVGGLALYCARKSEAAPPIDASVKEGWGRRR